MLPPRFRRGKMNDRIDEMRGGFLALGVLALAGSLAIASPALGTTAARDVTAGQLRGYLTSVGRLSNSYLKWKGGALRAVRVAPIAESLGDEETVATTVRGIRRAQRELTAVANRAKRVTAPAELRSLHAGFWRSIVSEAQCTGRVADALESGGGLASAVDRCKQTFGSTTARQRHWRSEVIAIARRLGVVVPFWVKRIGVLPK